MNNADQTSETTPELPDLSNQRIAFIGLGNMGGPMAGNLVKAGAAVYGYDVVPAALKTAEQQGVHIAEDIASAVRQAQVVITMLPSGSHVLDVYRGNTDEQQSGDSASNTSSPLKSATSGALAAAEPDTIFLDCSTIDVAEAQQAAELAQQAGFAAAEAPVSGGVVGAEAGSLAFMVGAPEDVFNSLEPLLDVMGGRVVHCGSNGMGQAAKVCNNMLLGVTMIGAAEAFVLGERLGLDHQALFDVVSKASGQCWSVTTNCPVPGPVPTSPANRDFTPGFASGLMAKDLGLASQALDQAQMTGRMGELAQQIYQEFSQGDGAGKDFSAIINQIREHNAQ